MPFLRLQARKPQFKNIRHFCQFNQTEDGRYCLGDCGCKRNACYTHIKSGHKKNIQKNIQHCRHKQINQGGNRISQTSEYTAEDIVISHSRNADEQNDEIGSAPVYDAVRCVQKPEQRTDEKRSDHHDEYGCDRRQCNAASNGPRQLLFFLCTEIL